MKKSLSLRIAILLLACLTFFGCMDRAMAPVEKKATDSSAPAPAAPAEATPAAPAAPATK